MSSESFPRRPARGSSSGSALHRDGSGKSGRTAAPQTGAGPRLIRKRALTRGLLRRDGSGCDRVPLAGERTRDGDGDRRPLAEGAEVEHAHGVMHEPGFVGKELGRRHCQGWRAGPNLATEKQRQPPRLLPNAGMLSEPGDERLGAQQPCCTSPWWLRISAPRNADRRAKLFSIPPAVPGLARLPARSARRWAACC